MTKEKPLVSVIIPCYNDGKYIDEAVNSILNQTYQNFEIIIVNDGSTDDKTNYILTNYNKPKTWTIHIENQGPSVARNIGIKASSGKYILPLDSDDKVAKTFLEKTVAKLEENENVGIACTGVRFFGTTLKNVCSNNYKFPEVLAINPIMNSSLFRKSDWEKVGGYNEKMRKGWEDYDFWLSIIETGKEVSFIPEPLCHYRKRWRSNSRHSSLTAENHKDCFYDIYNNHKKLYQDNIRALFNGIVELDIANDKSQYIINRLKLAVITLSIAIISIAIYQLKLYI